MTNKTIFNIFSFDQGKEEAAAKIVQLYRSECLNAEPTESTTSFLYPVFMLLVFILAIL